MLYHLLQKLNLRIQALKSPIGSTPKIRFRLTQRAKRLALGKVHRNRILFTLLLAIALGLSLLIPACTPDRATSPTISQTPQMSLRRKPVELSLVSFAVTRAAYAEIIPLFQKKWLQEQHQEVRFRQSYAGSSTQTRAVAKGLPADVVHLALTLDINQLQQAGSIEPGWQKKVPQNGIVTRTVAAIVTRGGNPKQIQSWSDLAKPEISVVTADPKTSGVARWNFLALWGSVTQTGGSEAQALDFVTQVYQNVSVLAKDARESTDIFLRQQKGDVLINYENELIVAAQEGLTENISVIIPQVNISIDNPIAVVDRYVNRRGTREVAEAFVQFLYTPEAQRAFAKVGFRPLEPTVVQEFADRFPTIRHLFTADVFGGWDTIQERFFKDNGIFDRIQANLRDRTLELSRGRGTRP